MYLPQTLRDLLLHLIPVPAVASSVCDQAMKSASGKSNHTEGGNEHRRSKKAKWWEAGRTASRGQHSQTASAAQCAATGAAGCCCGTGFMASKSFIISSNRAMWRTRKSPAGGGMGRCGGRAVSAPGACMARS